jgi:hypothetical protein
MYEDLVPYDETGKFPDVRCPFCNSKRKVQVAAACNFQFAQPEGTGRWISESTGHDYRFKHNLPKVLNERKQAELRSKTGANPYGKIDDTKNNSAWGEVK